jgi:hypothetical protein
MGILGSITLQADIQDAEKVKFIFEGNNIGCTIKSTSNNSCIVQASRDIGIIYIKGYLESNPDIYNITRITIKN